jgi:drug/metabolite transporter (DMT)-like permease
MDDAAAGAAKGRGLGIALILLSTVAWGSGGLFVRLLPFDNWTIVVWRGVFATLFIGLFVLWRFGRGTFAVIRGMGSAGLLATCCVTAVITIFVPALQRTTIANAMTIYAALPFFTAAIAWIWLREAPSRTTLLAALLALAGVAVMLGPAAGGPRSGDLLAMAGTACAALLTVVIRRNRSVEMLPVAGLATALSVPLALPFATQLWELTARDYLVAAGFGLGPMTLGMMLYVMGSALLPATLTALISTLEAPIGAAWAWLGVGEVPSRHTLLGAAIVLAAVFGRLLLERRGGEAHGAG